MKKVAKLLMVDSDDKYLMMYRSDHPVYGRDPDLPGGLVEDGETLVEAVVREVKEETNVDINPDDVDEVYVGNEYSEHSTSYSLFAAKVKERPQITMSWEHSSYAWIDKDEFSKKAKSANDTYMHMVADVISKQQI